MVMVMIYQINGELFIVIDWFVMLMVNGKPYHIIFSPSR
jgi:hypothetical protein